MILAGDIGGTNARLALFSNDAKKRVHSATFESRTFAGLEPIVARYLSEQQAHVDAACFGIAGPVLLGRCVATNLPWVVDSRRLARQLRVPHVGLINDLVAIGLGAVRAPASQIVPIGGNGRPKRTGGNLAIIAAGTGLGEAALVWDGHRHVPLATEGSHADFAPRTDLECDLLAFARKKLGGRVSYERCVSGPAIGLIYDFFIARGAAETKAGASAIAAAPDRNAMISRIGTQSKRGAAKLTIDLFVSLYGAETGNLALKTFSTAGVYIAGNIAGHLAPQLEGGAFTDAMRAKGRLSRLLETMPVALVKGTDHGLTGSAAFAAASLQG